MLHFVWQMTAIGKIESLRWFIRHIFNVDYKNHWTKEKENNTVSPTVHGEIFSNLVVMLKQNFPIQDQVQMNRLLQNCWFFFDISLKSLAIYMVQSKRRRQEAEPSVTHLDVKSNATFYDSLKSFVDLLGELIMKYASSQSSSSSKDNEFIAAYRCCNRSLANFVKVCPLSLGENN